MVAYVHNTVTNQLAAQQIYFPPQASQGAGPDDAPAAPSTWSPNRPRAPPTFVTDRNHDNALTYAALARLASDPSGTIVTSRASPNTRGIRGCCYRGEG